MIEGTSEIVRMPRLGKVRLGIKKTSDKTGAEYPSAVDYFVCPDEVKAVYGEQPKELDIMFPVEDPEIFAPQWLKCYSQTQGLVCVGDSREAHRKVDTQTGKLATFESETWEWHDVVCEPQECKDYLSKRCRRVMNLMFFLPDVPGIGIYQIDTTSFYSIVNINSMVRLLKELPGVQRCSMIPLKLVLGPIEVIPIGEKKKTVFIMQVKQDIKLADLIQKAQLPISKVLLPEIPDEAPDDLYSPTAIEDEPKKSTALTSKNLKKRTSPGVVDKTPEGYAKISSGIIGESSSPEGEFLGEPEAKPPPTLEEIEKQKEEFIKEEAAKLDELPPVLQAQPEEAKKKDANEGLRKRLHIEASNISPTYYETHVRAQMKVVFGKDTSKDLDLEQLNIAMSWMAALAKDPDKRAFVIKMKDLGYKDNDQIKEALSEITGKQHSWTVGDLDKTLIALEAKQNPTEAQQFLAENE